MYCCVCVVAYAWLCVNGGLCVPTNQARVFARVSPRNKELLVARLNALGHTTMMCGDGTNDVGALTQAHIGTCSSCERRRVVCVLQLLSTWRLHVTRHLHPEQPHNGKETPRETSCNPS